jgi:transposase
LPECTVAMEACASSHYWGRTIESLGHTVKLIHPRCDPVSARREERRQ